MNKQNCKYFHAIQILEDNCTGCTACVRVCPTEAIRVRDRKAYIDPNRCVDCGNCVSACEFHAIIPSSDPLDIIHNYKYKVAIISSSFFGQFSEDISYANAKQAVLELGFDEVAEEAMVTDFMISIIRQYIRENRDKRPILSSNCPAVVRLIQVKYPSLLPNLFHQEAPMSILTRYLREKISRDESLSEDEIGIFLIVPCVAHVTAVHQPEGAYKHLQDGAFSTGMIYGKVREIIKTVQNNPKPIDTYPQGLTWALSGVQAELVDTDDIRALSVNGVDNVMDILSRVEDHYLDQYDYIVLRSCTNGCVGGCLNVENPFVAMSRIKKMSKEGEDKVIHVEELERLHSLGEFTVSPLAPRPIMELDKDIKKAIQKMKKINEFLTMLPGLNCSACGSPTCYALAEDIVLGKASIDDCVVLKRGKISEDDNN
ncbi:MAG: [Fe-Fe] hydrogenase large subunit C-terminal domain-containing protein [Candidatus Cloacimonetes bacterium]|nr:4Fe-4S binding protein [Candidatus Cloacimonadota bacterium]MDY0298426.1 [Fe-Fe] hydrogenase large subunit C-terminal domain-containing protein [Candidatus Cloacimonadaceae bacterium]MCB5279040.1 4Fe-4S binding protein [Candidatus Cloacimonadota bacterium]MCK9333449.1 4Fe-4S binding protein [Candidatus Cloacimonadota bacterium]MDD2210166.1 [Fe-Fe] hydrogenase large subunit C-terminal domain-containing protein [Candidatus Cloacimonadota bacterium]